MIHLSDEVLQKERAVSARSGARMELIRLGALENAITEIFDRRDHPSRIKAEQERI